MNSQPPHLDTNTPISPVLLSLTQALRLAEIDAQLLPRSDTHPLEQVLVDLGDALQFQLYLPESLYADSPDYQALLDPEAEFHSLVFHWGLDLLLNRDRYLETYQLLAFFNQLLPLGAFDLNLNDSEIYFRYTLLYETAAPDPELVALVLDKLAFCLPPLAAGIVALHQSVATVAEVIEASLNRLYPATA